MPDEFHETPIEDANQKLSGKVEPPLMPKATGETDVRSLFSDEVKLSRILTRMDEIDRALEEPKRILEEVRSGQIDPDLFFERMSYRDEQLGREPDQYELFAWQIEVARELGGADVDSRLAPYSDRIRELSEEGHDLESTADGLATRELSRMHVEVVAKTDWDAVISAYLSGNIDSFPHTLGNIIALDESLEQTLLGKLSILDEYRTLRDNFTLPNGATNEVAEEWQPNPDVGSAFENWMKAVKAVANTYLSESRKKFVEQNLLSEERGKFRILALERPRSGQNSEYIPREIAYALEKHAAMLIQEFYDTDASYLQHDAGDRPNSLFIGNLPLFREIMDSDLDIPDWLNRRILRHNPELVRGIGFVDFVDGMEEIRDKRGSMHGLGGDMLSDENRIRLNIGSQLDRIRAGRGDKREKHRNGVLIGEVLDHELTHYAHTQRIPIQSLLEWEEIREAEQVHVTDYVEREHDPSTSISENPNIEDLADSA